MKRINLLILPLIILLSITPLLNSNLQKANATVGCRVSQTDCPSSTPSDAQLHAVVNYWEPYGPRVKNLQFKFYYSGTAEFTDFVQGHLDTSDAGAGSGPPPSQWPTYDNNLDLLLSPSQPSYAYYGIQFNYGASSWTVWGCDWQQGNSLCGIEMRQAFAHLIDRPNFAGDVASGFALADPSPLAKVQPGSQGYPFQNPYASTLAEQCSWDTFAAKYATVYDCIGAFNIIARGQTTPDAVGFAPVGSPNYCAAVDHLIQAVTYSPSLGLRRDPTASLDAFGNHCGIDPTSPGLPNIATHPLLAIVRSSDPTRVALARGFQNILNTLFTTTVSNFLLGNIASLLLRVFTCCTNDPLQGTPTDDWDWYTYGFLAQGPYPDHLNGRYNSSGSSNLCGGSLTFTPPNYDFLCIPSLDSAMTSAAQTGNINTFTTETLQAFHEFGSRVGDIPVYDTTIRTAALMSANGLVNGQGTGYDNQFTLLNARQGTYLPTNTIYYFGGNDPTTLRKGEAQPTDTLNPYNAYTKWELDVISQVYDAVFAANPTMPGQIFCWTCNTYSQTIDTSGNTHFRIILRQNLRWQDGYTLDTSDIKFSLLTLRDHALATPLTSQLLDVKILDPLTADIIFKGQSVTLLPALAQSLIIPRHIWEQPGDKTYGDVGTVDPAKLDYSYDPIVAGTFIGSGPYMCRASYGAIGLGCSSTGSSETAEGDSITLAAYDRTSEPGNADPFLQYMRSYNAAWGTGTGTAAFSGQFQEFSYADRFDNATVNLRSLVSAANCYGASSSSACTDYNYWLRPAFHPSNPNTISTEVDIVQAHYSDTWVYPYSWNGMQNQQPGPTLVDITPFTP